MVHSWCSMFLVMPCAKPGPCAKLNARACAATPKASGAYKLLKNPHAKPSAAVMVRPVNNNSLARPCPMTRGNKLQAPISAPARPTLENKYATRALSVPKRMSLAKASMAPAPAHTPSIAAMMGCGHRRIALTSSPVMRVNDSNSGMVILVSGPMISCTSPPEQKLPPAPCTTTTRTSLAKRNA